MTAKAILAIMLMLQPSDDVERYSTIAQAISEVSGGQPDLVGLLVATIRAESNFRREVHDGTVRGDAGRSWGLGQLCLGEGTTARGWKGRYIVGVDLPATRRAVAATAEALLFHRDRCRSDVACTMRNYVGRSVPSRVRIYHRIRGML